MANKTVKPLIDELTGKQILIVTSENSFISAIKNLEPVIEIKGNYAKSCAQTIHAKSHKKEFGGGLKASGVIIAGLGLIGGGPLGAMAALLGAGTFIGGTNLGKDGKNLNKYDLEMVSEDDVFFRLKSLL